MEKTFFNGVFLPTWYQLMEPSLFEIVLIYVPYTIIPKEFKVIYMAVEPKRVNVNL